MKNIRTIPSTEITDAVQSLVIQANYHLPDDVVQALRTAQEQEKSSTGQFCFQAIQKNIDIAAHEQLPLCQDTGLAVFFIEIGHQVIITGDTLEHAINKGVARAYTNGYLRKSVVTDPLFDHINTTDNTPAIIHVRLVQGDHIHIVFAPKGGGSENMSVVHMMKPADGVQGITDFVVQFVKHANGNPCPPTIVGIGIGGTFETCALLAKKALLRPVHAAHHDPRYAALERDILQQINASGVGPMGLGGAITALAVHIEYYPRHIASLPVAVNLQCHCARHADMTL